MAKVNHSQFAILGLLSMEPMSGYDIKREVKASLGAFWSESDGHLYPTLKKLFDNQLISETTPEKSNEPRNRKVYAITQLGRTALLQWLEQPAEPKVIREELILKLFFSANTSADVAITHLERTKQQLKDKLLSLNNVKKTLLKYQGSPEYLFWAITLDYGISACQSKLDWCERSLKLLEEIN